jgi:antitoxin (DNA-binding transcriptional repressor) of toxin-antitoxin stability system
VLTVNGSPIAVLIPADASTIDETLDTVRRARGLEALRAIRSASQKSDRGRLTSREIDTIIAKTRRARGRRARG